MAMGPYAAQDLSGLDIAYANRQRAGVRDADGHRYVPIADRMVEQLGRLGRKTKGGWYDYPEGGAAQPSDEVAALIQAVSREAGVPQQDRSPDELARRLMLAMIAEGIDILADGIARRAADVDLVLVHGYGFPRWRGGPMRLAEDWGLSQVRDELAALAIEDPLSWHVPPLLDRLIAEGKSLAGYVA
jgi:3-hydroxyacyl-CoA dehydrogenase